MLLTTPGLRRRADELELALASPGLRPAQTVELAVVERLQAAAQAAAGLGTPSEQFRSALRTRLMAVAAVQGVGAPAKTRAGAPAARRAVSWRQRAATVTAGVLAGAVAVTGVSVAASRSVPGDPFYGVKRISEDVQVRLAGGEAGQGRRHLQHAATRLAELRQLADRPGPVSAAEVGRVRGLLDDMDADTRAGARLLTGSADGGRVTGPLADLAGFADAQSRGLARLLPLLPAPVSTRAQDSLSLVRDVRTQAAALLALTDCTRACDPSKAPAGPGGSPCTCATGSPGAGQPAGPSPSAVLTPEPASQPTQQPGSSAGSGQPSAPGAGGGPQPAPAPSPARSGPLPTGLPSVPVPATTLGPPLGPLAPLTPGGDVPVPPLG